MYYDINNSLTYNCLFNFIIGARGTGKTYSAKNKGIKNFLNKDEQFIYLRRYQTELDEMYLNGDGLLFKDTILNKVFPEHKLENDDKMIYADDQPAGYMMALTTSAHKKSVPFPNVSMIIFDEFIIDRGKLQYLKNEVVAFLELYETIARMRDNVKVFFLSNAITVLNPYFAYFDLRLPPDKNIMRRGDILLELVHNQDFIDKKQETRFGKLIKGTAYGDYAIEAKFLRDSDTFIGKKTGKAAYYCTFKYKDNLYGIWRDINAGKFFVSQDVDPSFRIIYSFTLDDHSPNMLLIKNLNKAILIRNFIEAYKMGFVWFESMQIKGIVYEIIKMTMI